MNRNRLEAMTAGKREKGEKLFCAFTTLGFPDLPTTEKLIWRLEADGVDILELGFPFSDPMADGPTIQASSEAALRKGVGMEDAFRLVSRLRRAGLSMPVLFFSYLNPIYRYGVRAFLKKAAASGFDGVIIPDLPPGEEQDFERECRKSGLLQVFLVAPTTSPARAGKIARNSQGFIYYVSLKGVTGARSSLPPDIRINLKQLRKKTKKPVLVGFGVSTPGQARALSRLADGVIVGSALVKRLADGGKSLEPVSRFVRQMVRAVKGS